MRIPYSLMLLAFLLGCNDLASDYATPCTLPEDIDLVTVKNNSTITEEEEEVDYCQLPLAINDRPSLSFNIELYDFDITSEEKMIDALTRLKIVVNSQEFKTRVLAHEYNKALAFADNEGLSNEEIYNIIMDGAETLNEVIDNEVDLSITLYYEKSSTSGYTYPSEQGIWINDYHYATNSPAKVANTVLHEWTHKLGFSHDFYNTAKRPYSVPYGVGSIIQDLIEEL